MDRNQIQTMINDVIQETERIKDLIALAEKGRLDAEVELTTLQTELPELLANAFVGKAKRTEIVRMKKRMAELEEIIRDCPAIVKIFERDLARASRQGDKISARYERPLRDYEDLKAQTLDHPDSRFREEWCQRLLLMAQNPDLDCFDDAQRFLADLKGEVKS